MKALKNPVALATLLVLQACSSQPPQSGAADPASPPATLDKPDTIQPQTFMLRGKVIVGHESPDLGARPLPNLSFLSIDQPPPTPGADGRISLPAQRHDMRSKRAVGMRALAERGRVSHWFQLDADDLVNENFVATVSRMSPFDIALVRNGYAYYPSLHRSRCLDRIDRFCGSTVLTSDRFWIDPSAPDGRRYGNIAHTRVDDYAVPRGVPVHDYPGRGVAYVLGHGDNLYRTIGRRGRGWFGGQFLARRCDADFSRSFGFDDVA